MTYMDWIRRGLENYSAHLGMGTALNNFLMIIVNKDRLEMSKNFLANIVVQTITHLNQDSIDMVLSELVRKAAETMELDKLTEHMNNLCVPYNSCDFGSYQDKKT